MKRPLSRREKHPPIRLRGIGLFAGLLLAPVLAGCPGSLGAGDWPAVPGGGPPGSGGAGAMSGGTGGANVVPPPPNCDAVTMYFQKEDPVNGCAGAACHGGTIFGIDLASAGVWDRLLNKPASQAGACKGMPLVNPTKPASGVLISRVAGLACGDIMPYTGDPTTPPKPDLVTCITGWVNAQLP